MGARSVIILAVAALLCGCSKITEDEISGRYFIDNRLATPLYVEALSNQGPPVVLVDSIPANTVEVFMNVVEGTGGHVLPSNFLEELVITTNGDTVYSGIHNADWVQDDSPTRSDLVLVIE